jgi:glycosyltransferase involved in cell wall biosynthesis
VALWPVCRLRGWSYTYIVYDLYPDNLVELGHLSDGSLPYRCWSWAHRHVFANAANIVALGPVMRDRIIESAGPAFDPNVVEIIHNWQNESFIEPVAKDKNPFSKEHGLVEPFTVLYSGNIGTFHDLGTLVRAATAFEDEPVRFVIIGEGDDRERITALAADLGLIQETVTFLPYQPRDRLPYSLTAGDVSVVSLRRGFEGLCVSSKLYSAMAAGRPVLCISQPTDDEARIVDSFDAGEHVSQGDIEGLVETIERWREDPALVHHQGANARVAFEANFTTERSIDAYYRLLTVGETSAEPTDEIESERSIEG